jgi:hypothetical protein
MSGLINWWKGLSHNWKKVLIVNLDFSRKNLDITTYNDLYNQYLNAFGVGIRKRLDAFEVNEENISQITDLERLVIKHPGIANISEIKNFHKLKKMHVAGCNFDSFHSLKAENLESLVLEGGKSENLGGIEIFQNLKYLRIIYCYDLSDLDAIIACPKINHLDLSYMGRLISINPSIEVETIAIRNLMIYPSEIEHVYYEEKYHRYRGEYYEFSPEEIDFIIKNGNEEQKSNFMNLILTGKYSVKIEQFCDWILVKNY